MYLPSEKTMMAVIIEYYNSLKRMFIQGVLAANACIILQMLELLGFKEVWIKE
jgi:hypothetical protein